MAGLVALTGASGFVGTAMADRLARAGWTVRALIHSRPLSPELLAVGVRPVRGALDDPASLAALAEGADVAIHGAALIKARRNADFMAVNRDGARAMAQAAAGAGARLLMLSSLAAREPGLSPYAASKAAGEAATQEVSAGAGTGFDVLRPPAVYGEGDAETLKLLRWIARGVAPAPGGAGARISMIHVADLAEAILAWAASGRATGRIYEVDDGCAGGRSWAQIAAAAGEAMGVRPRLIAAPAPLLIAGAAAYEGLARALGRTPMVTAGKAREMCWPDWTCAPEAFQAEFGWRPTRDLNAGLRAALDWYRKAGWL